MVTLVNNPRFGRLKQENCHDFQANMGYVVSSEHLEIFSKTMSQNKQAWQKPSNNNNKLSRGDFMTIKVVFAEWSISIVLHLGAPRELP